jgi:hypothetical protein
MSLPLMTHDLSSVPSAFHGEYLHADGVYHLDVRGVEALKSALRTERAFRKEIRKLAGDNLEIRKLIIQAEQAAGLRR